jgi:hypothetical protein
MRLETNSTLKEYSPHVNEKTEDVSPADSPGTTAKNIVFQKETSQQEFGSLESKSKSRLPSALR